MKNIPFKFCIICKEKFLKKSTHSKKYWGTKKYCSFPCALVNTTVRKQKNSDTTGFKKGNQPWNKGISLTEEQRQKLNLKGLELGRTKGIKRPNLLGDKNKKWKGDKAGYSSKHDWIQRHYGNPMKCEDCCLEFDSYKNIQWASVGHTYMRNRADWKRLCTRCHQKMDKHPFYLKTLK